MDPLEYVWRRFEHERKAGSAEKAAELALFLVPYGHGKVAQVDNAGETVVHGRELKLD